MKALSPNHWIPREFPLTVYLTTIIQLTLGNQLCGAQKPIDMDTRQSSLIFSQTIALFPFIHDKNMKFPLLKRAVQAKVFHDMVPIISKFIFDANERRNSNEVFHSIPK